TATSATAAQVNCNTCHVQHGQKNDLARVASADGSNPQKLKSYLASLDTTASTTDQARLATTRLFTGTGPADVRRQNKADLHSGKSASFGAMPWYVWVAVVGLLPLVGLAVMAYGTMRRKARLDAATARAKPVEEPKPRTGSIDLEKIKAEAPAYPHP